MKGHFTDLAYDLRELNKALQEAITKHVPKPESYLSCFAPMRSAQLLFDYLSNLDDATTEKHKDLLELLKKVK